MGGASHGNGNANATSRGVHPPATAAVVAAKRGSGKGNGGKGGGGGSFVKFTVSARGRQWSSVRHVNETLEEFAAAIVRDARRLVFGDNDDSIQRLQLEYSEDSEPEDLHELATLGGVIIYCKGDEQLLAILKQHLAIVVSTQLTPPPRSFHPNEVAGPGANLPRSPRSSGKLSMGGAGQSASALARWIAELLLHRAGHSASSELANVLVRSSSHHMPGSGATGVSASSNTHSPATPVPTSGYQLQSLESELLSLWPTVSNKATFQCPHGATSNIALLAKFLASRIRELLPTGAALPSPASCVFVKAPKVTNPVANASPACNLQAEQENRPEPGMQEKYLRSPNHRGGANNEKRSLRSAISHGNSKEKSPSSNSSANVRNSLATRSGDGEGLDVELPNRGSELVFHVHRRSKTRLRGVGTHDLKMSEISAHFPLTLVNAAEELGVSQTTLKNACRTFGVKRWPGRKVRSLQSSMEGLLHESVVGQGAGLEELTEDYRKLQQEMDQLVHGTPAQITQKMHSPAVRTADLYKRLYSRGWRSKYHSAGRHDTTTLDTGNPTKRASGLSQPTTRKYGKAAKGNRQRKGPY